MLEKYFIVDNFHSVLIRRKIVPNPNYTGRKKIKKHIYSLPGTPQTSIILSLMALNGRNISITKNSAILYIPFPVQYIAFPMPLAVHSTPCPAVLVILSPGKCFYSGRSMGRNEQNYNECK